MNKELIVGLSSAIIALIGNIPYVISILRGNARPHRISMGIFTIVGLITFFNQVINGGGYSALFGASTAFSVLVFFVLSIKKGMGGKSKLDIICLISALVLLVFWLASSETRITTLLAIAIDIVAIVPTVHKVYLHPETEIYWAWIVVGVSGFITVFAVPNNDLILYAWPVYVGFANCTVALIKKFGHIRSSTLL
ncbi:MAG: hypothetical protein U0R17_06625 [Acidimicrobiia bacterium]